MSYLINMEDGRIVMATAQNIHQSTYYPISDKVANAIIEKKLEKIDVVNGIKREVRVGNIDWDKLMKNMASLNRSKITVKQRGEVFEDGDINLEGRAAFDMDIPGGDTRPHTVIKAVEAPVPEPEPVQVPEPVPEADSFTEPEPAQSSVEAFDLDDMPAEVEKTPAPIKRKPKKNVVNPF